MNELLIGIILIAISFYLIGVFAGIIVVKFSNKMYTEKQMIDFGNFLLREERKGQLVHEQNENCVTHADVENWKAIDENESFESDE